MMDLQTFITNHAAAHRAMEFANSGQLSLGEIISKCEALVPDSADSPEVIFGFEYIYPTNLDSWRGIYSELALGFSCEETPPTLDHFIETLKNAVGATFTGYKGGEYVMSENTPVWVANYGNSGNTAIVDVVGDAHQVILITRHMEE